MSFLGYLHTPDLTDFKLDFINSPPQTWASSCISILENWFHCLPVLNQEPRANGLWGLPGSWAVCYLHALDLSPVLLYLQQGSG